MKRILLAACAVVALAIPAMAAECVKVSSPPDGELAIHTAPNPHAAIRRWVHVGNKLMAYERLPNWGARNMDFFAEPKWIRVRGGWVDGRYIEECQEK